jgi:hypothetical protein
VKTHTIGATDNIVFAVDMATTRTAGRSLCAGDMNNDGRTDIAIFAGSTSLSAFFAEGRGELGVGSPAAAGTGLSNDVDARPHCADFNNDGKDDVALLTLGTNESVSVHRFQTSGFGSASRITANATSMSIADIDRDGDLDIVMASASPAAVLVAKNRGTGTFDTPTAFPLTTEPLIVTTGDFNGDRWPDVAAIDATGALVVLLSRGRN